MPDIENDIMVQFDKLLTEAVMEGLKISSSVPPSGWSRYEDYPRIYRHENDMPYFIKSDSNAPFDYGEIYRKRDFFRLFKTVGDILFPLPEIPKDGKGYELIQYCKDHKSLRVLIAENNYSDISAIEYLVKEMIGDCVDRCVQTFSSFDLLEVSVQSITRPVIRALTSDKLNVSIVVPIACLRFDFDRIKIADRTYIMKMSDNFQKARSRVKHNGSNANSSVVDSATHAFVLTNWFFPQNTGYSKIIADFSSIEAFPKETIDNLFASLRVVASVETGYSQLLYAPRDWTWPYYADLPSVRGTTVHKYPASLDNFGWNKPMMLVTSEMARAIGGRYKDLAKVQDRRIHIAIKRLNSCHLRDDDEDTVIDACIGLEALLNDGEGSEITHKLALRCAALEILVGNDSEKVFREIKDVYAVRSNIVHGGKRKNKLTDFEAAQLAVRHLTKCIDIILRNPKFLIPAEIDKELLLKQGQILINKSDID